MRKGVAIFSWALYDFANTIFTMNVISLYFALWVTIDKSGEDILYSLALSISLICSAIFEPLLGSLSDILRRKIPFLIFFTVVCASFTMLLGFVGSLFMGLVIFIFANFGYQLAGVFYNALLVDLGKQDQIGKISGFGVSLGYVGTITGLLLIRPIVLRYGHQSAFLPTGILYLVFALPCFWCVRENKTSLKLNMTLLWTICNEVYKRVRRTLFSMTFEFQVIRRFFLAAFFFLSAVSTIIVFMSVYVKKAIGLSDAELINLYLFSTLFTILGSFLFGFITDRLRPRRALSIVMGLWIICLLTAGISFNKNIFWVLGPFAGVTLGSTWVASRAYAVELAPKQKIGEIFGLFGIVGKCSSIVGPTIWGLLILIFAFLGNIKYRIAILFQIIFILLGYLFLRKIDLSLQNKPK